MIYALYYGLIFVECVKNIATFVCSLNVLLKRSQRHKHLYQMNQDIARKENQQHSLLKKMPNFLYCPKRHTIHQNTLPQRVLAKVGTLTDHLQPVHTRPTHSNIPRNTRTFKHGRLNHLLPAHKLWIRIRLLKNRLTHWNNGFPQTEWIAALKFHVAN